MKKIKKLIIIILLLSPLVYATDFSNYQSLNVNFSINSHLDVQVTAPNPFIESLTAIISLAPSEDARQKIIDTQKITEPKAEVEIDKEITLSWKNLDTDKIYFNLISDIQTTNNLPKISSPIKYPFPLEQFVVPYTKAADYIDITHEIGAEAKKLAQDKTDLYEIVYTIANWTNYNVQYDLDSLTAETIQKSSWVFKNKRGVCDEITNLFISLVRSINIPARFVAGTVHSNLIGGWGNHGWAEVYFPRYGWIPFDITLGQYGWIDPSHIKLSESIDSARPVINYKWRSSGVKVIPSNLNIETYLKSANGEAAPKVLVKIDLLEDKVGFNSYIPVKVTLTNLVNYYIIPKVYLSKGPASAESVLFLKPNEKKTLFWVLKLPALEEQYQYTSPVEITTSFGSMDASTIRISDAYKQLTYEQNLQKINFDLSKESKAPFSDLTISCSPDAGEYYPKVSMNIKCSIKGPKKDLSLCIQGVCQKVKEDNINLQTIAEPEIEIYIEDETHIKHADIRPKIIEVPNVQISNINPLNMDYNDEIDLRFTLATNYPADNVKVYLNNREIYQTERLNKFENLKIKVNSKSLVGKMKFKITYEDSKGRTYVETSKYLTTVRNSPWTSKLSNYFNTI